MIDRQDTASGGENVVLQHDRAAAGLSRRQRAFLGGGYIEDYGASWNAQGVEIVR